MKHEEAEIQRSDRGRRLTYEDAMGNDIINAIIELVTNADDSYCSLEEKNKLHTQARIRIEIERHHNEPTKLIVRDRAEGMSYNDLKKFIQREGDLHRKFNPNSQIRGMFGSGSKEVTHFGKTIFESIKGKEYSCYEIPKGGGNKNNKPTLSRDNADNHRKKLGIQSSGTVVTIYIDSQQFIIPQYSTLKHQLQITPQLQSILKDENRHVMLKDLANPENEDRLLVVDPSSELIYDELEIEIPGYNEAIEETGLKTTLTLKRSHEPLTDTAGILIKAGRTIFTRDQFGQINQAHADLFFGELNCPFLWRLIAEAEARDADDLAILPDGENDKYLLERVLNPSRPISRRRRSGLDRTHPFIARLHKIVQPIITSERQRSVRLSTKQVETKLEDKLNQELSDIASKLGNLLEGNKGSDIRKDFYAIPSGLHLKVGENKSFHIYANSKLISTFGEQIEAVVIQGEEIIQLEKSNINLTKRDSKYSASLNVKGIKEGDGQILVALGSEDISIKISVGSIEEEEQNLGPIYFDRASYSVRSDGSRKTNLRVFVTKNLFNSVKNEHLSLSLRGDAKISEAIKIEKPTPKLKKDPNGVWSAASRLSGGRGGNGLIGKLTASYGNETTTALIKLTSEENTNGSNLPFIIKYKEGLEARNSRFNWLIDEDPQVLQILTDHLSIKPIYKNSKKGNIVQSTPELSIITKEISASAVAFRHIQKNGLTENQLPEALMGEYEKIFMQALDQIYGD